MRGTPADAAAETSGDRIIPACAGNASDFLPLNKPANGSSPRVRGTQPARRMCVWDSRIIPACAGNAPIARASQSRQLDHPRVCGERIRERGLHRRRGGSSPRVRGTLGLGVGDHRRRRIIPACAGNASSGGSSIRALSDHPRVCGERVCAVAVVMARVGSSPRVRGTHAKRNPTGNTMWIIPACAGNAGERRRRCRADSDHPRVCGERMASRVDCRQNHGSSPRVRGTLSSPTSAGLGSRIIPACAGNAAFARRSICFVADHPRVCGERRGPGTEQDLDAGSSPRVRGTPQGGARHVHVQRIIPACAGNANRRRAILHSRPDHPRVCGERGCHRSPAYSMRGSSPRVRGTPRSRGESSSRSRIIPACAGNAPITARAPSRPPDHPRVCGERCSSVGRSVIGSGSSPRVRGTL